MIEYQHVICQHHLLLHGVWAAMDGLKVYLQQASVDEIQQRHYNGWQHNPYVKNCFVLSRWNYSNCIFNMLSSEHDSHMIEHHKLESTHKTSGGKFTIDFAFGKYGYPFLIKPSDLCRHSTGGYNKMTNYIYASIC